jgi:diacylglycerol diphosphate phosphatase/phosphatidate phosphatase
MCVLDIIDRCQAPPGALQDQLSRQWGLSNYTICTQTDAHILEDGFKSFPSGHSSCQFPIVPQLRALTP